MAANRQTYIHTHVHNVVPLVWGSLRLATNIFTAGYKVIHFRKSRDRKRLPFFRSSERSECLAFTYGIVVRRPQVRELGTNYGCRHCHTKIINYINDLIEPVRAITVHVHGRFKCVRYNLVIYEVVT